MSFADSQSLQKWSDSHPFKAFESLIKNHPAQSTLNQVLYTTYKASKTVHSYICLETQLRRKSNNGTLHIAHNNKKKTIFSIPAIL